MLPLPILDVRLDACSEDWQQMTPTEQGRHCAHCNRTVLDFTASTQTDLDEAFKSSSDGRVCGHFRQSQLAAKPQLRPKLRRFLVVLVLVCGLGMTSGEAWAQVRKAARVANCTIDTELMPRTAKELNPMTLLNHVKHQSVTATPVLPELAWVDESDVTGGFMGVVVRDELPNREEPQVYVHVEEMPEYKFGGLQALPEFVRRNLRWPKEVNAGGRVLISFIIDKTGRMRNAYVLKGINPLFDAEALRVIKLLNGQFTPGRQNKRPVNVRFTFPITFEAV